MPMSARDFCRKNPVDTMIGSRSGGIRRLASARASGIAREERRRHHVHALIGGLRGEDRRDQQLERRAVVRARCRRPDDGARARRRCAARPSRDFIDVA